MKRALVLLAFSLLSLGLAAQTEGPVTQALMKTLQRDQPNLVGAAQEMPPDKYAFKATPGQMSFGELVSHTAMSNDMLCSHIAGTPAPQGEAPGQNAPKDKLVKALQDSFSYCSQALGKVSENQLGQMVPFFGGRQVTRAQAMVALAADWADHYSLAATYLRLNGLTPPSAQKK